MVAAMREWFNGSFSMVKYHAYRQYLEERYPGMLQFRIAETPVFVPKAFQEQMLSTCEYIIDTVKRKDFKQLTQPSVAGIALGGESGHPHFLVFDFGICQKEDGSLEPQLVEMQGFPSLFMYQLHQDEAARAAYNIPDEWQIFLNGFDKAKVIDYMRETIVGDSDPENVILLDLYPGQQKTKIDFFCTEQHLGVRAVCLTDLHRQGDRLFYPLHGRLVPIERIYNRLVLDEVRSLDDAAIQAQLQLLQGDVKVAWVSHPEWFYRISKFTLPFLRHPHIPETHFLYGLTDIPADLENYVLKPLFSFGGRGVIIDVKKEDLDVPHPENYILQKKVNYAAAIRTPDEPAKAEIRIFYMWRDGDARPVATHNLARLTKGKMIGVGYNQDKEWTGGSFAYFDCTPTP